MLESVIDVLNVLIKFLLTRIIPIHSRHGLSINGAQFLKLSKKDDANNCFESECYTRQE